MNHRNTFVVSAALVALALASFPASALSPAQTPKPPTDAKKIVQKPSNGTLNFTAEDFGFSKLDTQARDFDVTFTIVNPSLAEFLLGLEFREVTFTRTYMMFIDSTGQAVTVILRDINQVAPLKDPIFAASWKKNVGEKNDVGLYVRGGQAMLFINKQFVDQWDVSEINDFGDMYLFAAGPRGQSGSIEYKNLTVKVPANAMPPTANGPANKNIVLSMYRSGYTQWGRPLGMDDPRKGCSAFDDSRPVLQFQAVMKVTNNTKIPMKRWGIVALKRDGKPAFGCTVGYNNSPAIEPGASADVTIEYYINQGEAIATVFVFDLDQGQSNRLQTAAP